MPSKLSTQFQIVNYSNSKGLNTIQAPTEIGDADFQALQNIRFSRFGFGPRLGVDILGTNANNASTNTGVRSLFVFERANGTVVTVRAHTTFLEWLDYYGTDTWRTVRSGLTTNLNFGFLPFNKAVLQLSSGQTADNNLLNCNGTEALTTWSGGVGHIASTTATTIVLTNEGGSDTLFTLGFDDNGASTGSLTINGTAYTYNGSSGSPATDFSTLTFSGVTPDPTGEAVASAVIQTPATVGSNNPRGNVFAGAYGRVLTSKNNAARMYYSASGDETTFTAGDDYANAGFETFIEGNGGIQGIISNNGKVFVLKKHAIIQWLLSIFAATTATNAKRTEHNVIEEGFDAGVASLQAAATVKGQVARITPKGNLRFIGSLNNLTDRILPTLSGFNTSSAAIGYDPNEDLIYASMRGVNSAGQTSTINDTLIVYDVSGDALSVWTGLNLSSFAYDHVNEKMLAGDASDAVVYEMNVDGKFSDDIGSGERAPIVATAVTKRFNFGLPALNKASVYYMVRGFILPSAKIQVDFSFNEGTIAGKTKIITGLITNKYVLSQASHTIGSNPIGEVTIGIEESDRAIEGMNPFLVYLKIPNKKYNDVDVTFAGVALDGNGWWIREAGFAVSSDSTFNRNLVI